MIGVVLLLYPTVSDYVNGYKQNKEIQNFTESVAVLEDEEYEELLQNAKTYNEQLLQKPDRWKLSNQEKVEYEKQLSYNESKIIGTIEIPKIKLHLPVYHGVEEKVLQVAIGHMEGSSLPIGGESTHSVLTGHRGLASARLFTDLDQLEEGDIFKVTVLDEILTYEVDQIRIVEPEDLSPLIIEEGKDYCTLVTCTPYGINTHRLLVRGTRIQDGQDGSRVSGDALLIDPKMTALFIAIPILIVLVIWVWIGTGKKKRRKKL